MSRFNLENHDYNIKINLKTNLTLIRFINVKENFDINIRLPAGWGHVLRSSCLNSRQAVGRGEGAKCRVYRASGHMKG